MTTSDSGEGSEELLCTPRRAHKRLFAPGGSSTKRSLFQQAELQNQMDTNSGDESDLGPMSPLALTDHSPSSTYSSPGRHFISPLASPEGSPHIPLMNLTWDRLKPAGSGDKRVSPFSTLKYVTKTARSSPRRRIFPASPKSVRSPDKTLSKNHEYISPVRTMSRFSQEFIPETPLRDSLTNFQDENTIAETPQKEDSPEYKQITPLGSVNKDASLPRLHRRKTLGAFEVDEISPEKKGTAFKRHINDPIIVGAKLQKTEEPFNIPKARAALFQDKSENTKNVTLDTKSFYGSGKQERLSAFGVDWKQVEHTKKRRSLPAHHINHTRSNFRQSQRKHKKGEINCGVSHGLKKPKPKKHVSRVEAFRKEKQASPPAPIPETAPVQSESRKSQEGSKLLETKTIKKARSPSPQIDPTKRFFKRIRAKPATVTVNKKIKLNVSEGKISLDQKKVRKNQHKKPKLDFLLDATDLIIDEPEFESSKKKDVAKLIKVLEDDWTDDEYEPMDILQSKEKKIQNPTEEVYPSFQDAIMSPASELSNMTSVMNIEDSAVQEDNIYLETEGENQTKEGFYPLFTKGYSNKNVGSPKNRGVKRPATWQLSSKADGTDQYQLDCGQKNLGATQCNECGVVYQVGDAQDENAHLNFHNSVKTLKFQGWKNEKLVWDEEHTASRIILVEPSDPKQHWKKVSEILNVVDSDLGLADMQLSYYRDKNVYLYVRDKNVLGVLVAEPVKEAHRMIPELVELDCCSSESTPAKCGINVVWTAMSHRRQGIARQLVDTIRRSYYFGYIMTMDDIAFSTPTPSGKTFAEKYTKTRNFKVYN